MFEDAQKNESVVELSNSFSWKNKHNVHFGLRRRG
jgi:hypothetical protein